ncbi:MAG TPA: DNA repair protein RadA [Armatimonadota bacterium]|nr:DNA repair protein RadA [Armatimonadota bacterium]
MPKAAVTYVCSACGVTQVRWHGRCPECGAWGALVEEAPAPVTAGVAPAAVPALAVSAAVPLSELPPGSEPRRASGVGEFDRVLGGGAVPGSVILLAGDPGIGKSTLLLQVGYALACAGHRALYVSGEESLLQVRLRAERLRTLHEEMLVLAETELETIIQHLRLLQPAFAVVDSIQTTYDGRIESVPGAVSQVRNSALRLIRAAKETDTTILLIGHVTKEGQIAGPRVLEHMVDVVLELAGDRDFSYRILRAVKNRFGPTHEMGVFTMADRGMEEVPNPSAAFLHERQHNTPGSAVAAVMEGTRALLVEVQALVTPAAPFGAPRRNATGIDPRRLAHLLAVLEKRCRLPLGQHDVFVNVPGGVKLTEPAVDLALALALASSLRDVPVREGVVCFGEVGLTGEVRTVSHADRRIAEAARQGFLLCLMPPGKAPRKPGLRCAEVGSLDAAFSQALGG